MYASKQSSFWKHVTATRQKCKLVTHAPPPQQPENIALFFALLSFTHTHFYFLPWVRAHVAYLPPHALPSLTWFLWRRDRTILLPLSFTRCNMWPPCSSPSHCNGMNTLCVISSSFFRACFCTMLQPYKLFHVHVLRVGVSMERMRREKEWRKKKKKEGTSVPNQPKCEKKMREWGWCWMWHVWVSNIFFLRLKSFRVVRRVYQIKHTQELIQNDFLRILPHPITLGYSVATCHTFKSLGTCTNQATRKVPNQHSPLWWKSNKRDDLQLFVPFHFGFDVEFAFCWRLKIKKRGVERDLLVRLK